jgi:hypothetical protein
MIEFRVWSDGYNDEESAHTVFALDAEQAATEFFEENHSNFDYADEIEVTVKHPDGTVKEFVVTAEETTTFSATLKKPKETKK